MVLSQATRGLLNMLGLHSTNRVAALHEALRRSEKFRSRLVDPDSPETKQMCDLMNELSESDLGLDTLLSTPRVGEIAYVPLIETDEFHICIFVLGPAACIPLHDHPNMTVLSRVMQGSITLSSYDILHPIHNQFHIRAVRHADSLICAPANTIALFPNFRNCHAFLASDQGAVVFDILLP